MRGRGGDRGERGTGESIGSPARPLPILIAGVVAITVLLIGVAVALEDGDDATPTDRARHGHTAGPGRTPATTPAVSTTSPPPKVTLPKTTSAPPATTVPACRPVVAVHAWPLRRRLAALVMVGVDPSGTTGAAEAVAVHGVGGIFVGGDDTGLLSSGTLVPLRMAAHRPAGGGGRGGWPGATPRTTRW